MNTLVGEQYHYRYGGDPSGGHAAAAEQIRGGNIRSEFGDVDDEPVCPQPGGLGSQRVGGAGGTVVSGTSGPFWSPS